VSPDDSLPRDENIPSEIRIPLEEHSVRTTNEVEAASQEEVLRHPRTQFTASNPPLLQSTVSPDDSLPRDENIRAEIRIPLEEHSVGTTDEGEPMPQANPNPVLPMEPPQEEEEEPPEFFNQLSVSAILTGIGNGSITYMSSMQLHKHPQMIAGVKNCYGALKRYRERFWFHCPVCGERSDETEPADAARTECTKCRASRRGNQHRIAVFSTANNGNPMPVPHNLPELTHTEEILIARNHVAMKCYRLPGGSMAFKGSVVNLEKRHLDATLNSLPVPVNQLPMRLIVKFGTTARPRGAREFVVRNNVVRTWLEYLKQHNPAYSDITINQAVLDSLPEDGSVIDDIPVVEIEPEADPATATVPEANHNQVVVGEPVVATNDGNNSANNNNDDDDDPDEQANGPDQCGATGQERGDTLAIPQEYIGQPVDRPQEDNNGLMDEQIRRRILHVPAAGGPINDYETPNLQAHCFPTLFPHGVGDFSNHDRLVDERMIKVARHQLFYCLMKEGQQHGPARYEYPFVLNNRWPNWIQNTTERHRFNGQKRICMSKLPDRLVGMNIDELNEFIRQGDPERMRAVTSKMQMFSANIVGSDAYFSKKRRELESLMQEKGMPTLWFTFSAADNHWKDLHALAEFDAGQFADRFVPGAANATSEIEKAKRRRQWVRDNPHIVDLYFHRRFKEFFASMFGKDCLDAEWYWYRTEYQKRGCAHIHGCCRLKSDPNLHELSQKIVHGQEAQLAWLASGASRPLPDSHFAPEDTEEDTIERKFEEVEDTMLEEDDEVTLDRWSTTITEGVDAQRRLVAYHDILLTAQHPSPPSDAMLQTRDPETRFQQTETNVHPCHVDEPNLLSTEEYSRWINAVQRHMCGPYCKRTRGQVTYCRFSYPLKLRLKTIVVVRQLKLKKGGYTTIIDIFAKRNDMWINIHCRVFGLGWLANFDLRLTIDIGKILQYMTKYVTKTETNGANIERHFRQCYATLGQLVAAAGDDVPAERILKALHSQLHGQRSRSLQEVCHLTMSLPLVSSDHSFVTINLLNDSTVIDADE
ncbi:MAG: DUF6570 domain-containing protein, partial [Holophagaceae bacterium]